MNSKEKQGMISISKFEGNQSSFFGSDIFHSGGVSIKISNCNKERNLSHDNFYTKETVIEVELSYNQFVEMITAAMNTQGVPCTFRFKNGKYLQQECYVEDSRDLFKEEMKSANEGLITRLTKLEDDIEKLKVSKKIKKDLTMSANVIKSHLSNYDFVAKSFDKKINNTVLEAKNSISNYVDHKIYSLGVENLREQIEAPANKIFEITDNET